MIACKPDVRFKYIREPMLRAMGTVIVTWKKFCPGIEPVITSANDSTHGKNSLHYSDLALDLRSKNLTSVQKDTVLKHLKEYLGRDYDILLESRNGENEHFHLEYDPKSA